MRSAAVSSVPAPTAIAGLAHESPGLALPDAERRAITAGLLAEPARIDPKYFYDNHGSALFEAITRQPEYYPTRVEAALLRTAGAEIAAELAGTIGPIETLIEPGAGNCTKAAALCALLRPRRFVALDIAGAFLDAAVRALARRFPDLESHAIGADLTHTLHLPESLPRQRRLVFYPGSSIGNFDPSAAGVLLARMRALLDDDGALLVGIDLVKDEDILHAAYNDAAGVTAAFNRNVLAHLNRLIGSDFNPDAWHHRAFFNRAASRIEMHLEARCDQRVGWPGGRRRFARGERIHTENSYKYRVDDFVALLAGAGFAHSRVFTDATGWYALVVARPR